MNKKGRTVFLIIIILGFFIAYLFINPDSNFLAGYLSKSEQVKANILLVEGWIPDFAVEKAYEEFQQNGYEYLITTGLKYNDLYFELSENGYLIFYPKNRFSGMKNSGSHSIEIDAYSELGGDNRAHFNLFLNGSLTADFLVEKRKKKYGVIWNGNLNKIDSILVQFTNDDKGEFGDRNLYVKEIIIDHKITIPYLYNSEFDASKLDGKHRFINKYDSNAEFIRNKFLSLGIDSAKVIATYGKGVINRTLSSAVAFRDWIKTSNLNIKGINIISMGTHSRRTWLTYNKVLHKKYQIGMISIPDSINSGSRIGKVLNTIREIVEIFYYRIILIAY